MKMVPGGAWLAGWMARAKLSKPKACAEINARYMERTGSAGKLTRAGLHRYMVGDRTPSVDWAVSIHAASGCPIELWTKSANVHQAA